VLRFFFFRLNDQNFFFFPSFGSFFFTSRENKYSVPDEQNKRLLRTKKKHRSQSLTSFFLSSDSENFSFVLLNEKYRGVSVQTSVAIVLWFLLLPRSRAIVPKRLVRSRAIVPKAPILVVGKRNFFHKTENIKSKRLLLSLSLSSEMGVNPRIHVALHSSKPPNMRRAQGKQK